MKIVLSDIGKKYHKEWVFRQVNQEFNSGEKWVIKGSNGSGKSTLVKVLSGFTSASEGSITYHNKKYRSIYKNFSFSAPYLDLIEDFTLLELHQFQSGFKPFSLEINHKNIYEVFNLPDQVKKKRIKDFSSGMKQRVKLGMAILSDNPVVVLDEPVSNMDSKGIDWYHHLINQYALNKLVIVCSNSLESEYDFCNKELSVEDFK